MGFQNLSHRVWVPGSGFENFPKKPGFGFRFGLGFVKNIKIPAKFIRKIIENI
jgi:hypothetical protein